MKKNRKVQLAVALLGFTAAAAGMFAWNGGAVEAQATSASFAMRTGASVRAKANESGIRWETNVTQAWFENTDNIPAGASEISFGTLVADADVVKNVGDVIAGGARVVDIPCETTSNFFKSGDTFKYYSAIKYNNVDVADQEAAYAEELIARSYVKYKAAGATEFTYVYAEAEDTARCMRAVALVELETTDTNDALMKTYLGDAKTDVDFAGYYETKLPETIADYSTAYLGAKKVGEVSNGKLTLTGLTLGENYALTLFDASGNYAATTEFQYITALLYQEKDGEGTVTKDTFKDYIYQNGETVTIKGYYVLSSDIEVSDIELSSADSEDDKYYGVSNTFVGTLDGKGHTISGINAKGSQKGGLFWKFKGSLVNVAIKGEQQNQNGLITDQINGTANLQNVYVETTISNTTLAAPVARYIVTSGTIGMKNVVLYSTMTDKRNGAVIGFMKSTAAPTFKFENCYYITLKGADEMAKRTDSNINANNQDCKYFWDIGDTKSDGTVMTTDDGWTGYTDYNTFYDAAYNSLNTTMQSFLPAKTAQSGE